MDGSTFFFCTNRTFRARVAKRDPLAIPPIMATYRDQVAMAQSIGVFRRCYCHPRRALGVLAEKPTGQSRQKENRNEKSIILLFYDYSGG